MQALKNTEKYFPYSLPFLLIFFRGLADLTVLLVSLIFLFKSFKNNDWNWTKEIWFKYAILFIFYLSTVNAYISIDSYDTLFYALTFLRWPIFAAALYLWVFKEHAALKKFITSCLFVLFFIIFDVWIQYYFGTDIFGYDKYSDTRLTGPLRNNPVVGIFITKYFFIAFTGLIIFKIINKKNIFISSLILLPVVFFSVFITGERMSLILFSSSIFLIGLGFGENLKDKLFFLFSFLLAICILIFIFNQIDPQTYSRAVTSSIDKIYNLHNSDYGMVFRTAYQTWLVNPIFGGGLHQFKDLYPLYDISIWSNVKIYHPHNHPLSLMAETGIVGLLLFYLMVFHIMKRAINPIIKQKNWMKLALIFNLFFICFFPFMTHFSFQHNWMNATTWLIVGITLALNNRIKNV